jgi:invasion protein IalB
LSAKSALWSLATALVLSVASGVVSAQETPAPAPAPAATPPAAAAPAPPSPWLKVCNVHPETKAEICVVTQEVRAETGQPIAAVTIQKLKDEGKYGMGLVVPIHVRLPEGVVLTVDGEKRGAAQYVMCIPPSQQQPAACIAQAEINEDFISSLRKGNELAVVVMNPQNKPIGIKLSLVGFSKTFDGKGVDRAAAEAQREQLSEALQKSAEEARKKLIEQQQKEIEGAPQ